METENKEDTTSLTDANIAGLYHASQGQPLREQDASRVRKMARSVEAFLVEQSVSMPLPQSQADELSEGQAVTEALVARMQAISKAGFELGAALTNVPEATGPNPEDFIRRDAVMALVVEWREKMDAAPKVDLRAALTRTAAPAPEALWPIPTNSDTDGMEAGRIIGRLMSSDPDFDDCADAASLIHKLIIEKQGADGQAVAAKELEAEARAKVDRTVHVDNSAIDCVLRKASDVMNDDVLFACFVEINHKRIKVEARVRNGDQLRERAAAELLKKVSESIAAHLLGESFKAAFNKFEA